MSLGSNLGNKRQYLSDALALIGECVGEVDAVSAFYETAPLGFESDNMFMNIACSVVTSLPAIDILELTQTIEKELGRKNKSINQHYSDRCIDIDLVMYGQHVISSPQLTLPHPRFHERLFVLQPLCDIAPEVVHPILQKTIRQLRDIQIEAESLCNNR